MFVSTDLSWQFILHVSAPQRVFRALVATACANGRLLAVESFGTALVVSPSCLPGRRRTPVRVTVADSDRGTLVRFSSADAGHEPADAVTMAESVGTMVHEMRQRLDLAAA